MVKSAKSTPTSTIGNPYASPSDKDKRTPTKSPQSPTKLPQSPTNRNILKVTNVLCPDGTPYGYLYENAYDIKEQLKALSNIICEAVFIGGLEFKYFSNLSVKWIKESFVGNLLWVMRIDEVVTAGNNEHIFPMSAHKAYSNKVVRAIVAEKIKTLAEIEIKLDLTLTESEMENMDNMFGEMTGAGNTVRDALLEEFIAEADEDLEELI
jgi:hypothetical protein